MLFGLGTGLVALILFVAVFGATVVGSLVGRRLRHLSSTLSEPVGVLQAALLGLVALILAFGLSLALSRHENRRALIVTEANAIGTTYLRAQTLPEPLRSDSLELLVDYTQSAVEVADNVPGGAEEEAAIDEENAIQRELWALAGEALEVEPEATAPRLYVETLNEMIDAQTARVAALDNRVPGSVLLLEIVGASLALGLLAAFLGLAGRGVGVVLGAAVLVAFLLFVTVDLDRPTRGAIQVPDRVLVQQLESMREPPAASAPAPTDR